jgi:hypothetical protein
MKNFTSSPVNECIVKNFTSSHVNECIVKNFTSSPVNECIILKTANILNIAFINQHDIVRFEKKIK